MFDRLTSKPQPSSRMDSVLVAPIRTVDPVTGRVQVSMTHTGAKSLSPPLWRLSPANGLTFPSYHGGDTLAYSFIDGNPNQGVQLGIIQNAVNPPSYTDRMTYILGESLVIVTKDSIVLSVGASVFTLMAGSLKVEGITSFKVNGKEVATVGATDDDGDDLVTKGWS